MYCHSPVRTTEFVLYKEVPLYLTNNIFSNINMHKIKSLRWLHTASLKTIPAKERINLVDVLHENMYVCMYAKQKHLGCKKSARPRRSSILNELATKSSDIR